MTSGERSAFVTPTPTHALPFNRFLVPPFFSSLFVALFFPAQALSLPWGPGSGTATLKGPSCPVSSACHAPFFRVFMSLLFPGTFQRPVYESHISFIQQPLSPGDSPQCSVIQNLWWELGDAGLRRGPGLRAVLQAGREQPGRGEVG